MTVLRPYSRTGWQTQRQKDLAASWKGGVSGGGGFIHVPGQTGTYAEYLRRGGPEEGIGSARILAGGRMAAYRSGVRLAGSTIRAPITYTTDPKSGRAVFVPTESLKGGEAFMPLPGSPIARGITGGTGVISDDSRTLAPAGSGIAAGGTALARGGPAVGTAPGGGLSLSGISSGVGSSLSGVGGSLSTMGSGIMNTVTQYLPLAIKIIIAVIVIKIVLALVRGRKR